MQLSENDKTLILAKKDNIQKISGEIFILLTDPQKNRTEILDKMNQIVSNLADLCAISNYLDPEPELSAFRKDFWSIQMRFESEGCDKILRNHIERFCNRANSITFYEKVGIFSNIQIKIESFHIHIIDFFNNIF